MTAAPTHGWTDDHTWAVAVAMDNYEPFQAPLRDIIALARAGDVGRAAAALRVAVVDERKIDAILASWADLDRVDWVDLVAARWAAEAE